MYQLAQSVDLAVDYVLPHILNQGVLNVKTIAQCLGESLEDSCASAVLECAPTEPR